ncbi:polyhydroxyalkanoate synthesis regulator DNA-binding domain-containing protein [Desulfocicer niacini]
MLNIKKYSNGRFFDTAAKEYIKPEKLAELIKKGEKIQVTLTKTGKDITDVVIGQFLKKEEQKKDSSFRATDKLVKWLGEVIDTKIEQVMDVVKLPTREQVANLDKNIKELNKKIDALTLSRDKVTTAKSPAPEKSSDAPKSKASKP